MSGMFRFTIPEHLHTSGRKIQAGSFYQCSSPTEGGEFMAVCLILTPDHNLPVLMETALEDNQLTFQQISSYDGTDHSNVFSDAALAVIDTHFAWKFARNILPVLEKMNLPILFICSSSENQKHLLKLYRGKCAVLVNGCSSLRIGEAMNYLLERSNETLLTIGSLQLNTTNHQAALNGSVIPLTLQEYRLLYILMRNPNALMTREELLRKAWNCPPGCITRTVDIHIGRLRKKLGTQWIETVHCFGYRLNAMA